MAAPQDGPDVFDAVLPAEHLVSLELIDMHLFAAATQSLGETAQPS
ncbi:hypothetical protein [Streptomyces sp. NPDC005181]